jgi:hypothetical protein
MEEDVKLKFYSGATLVVTVNLQGDDGMGEAEIRAMFDAATRGEFVQFGGDGAPTYLGPEFIKACVLKVSEDP